MQIFLINIYNFRHFLHILSLFRQFFYILFLSPRRFGLVVEECDMAGEEKEEVAQPVDEPDIVFLCLRFDHSPLGSPANSTCYMAPANRFGAGRQEKTILLGNDRLNGIDP